MKPRQLTLWDAPPKVPKAPEAPPAPPEPRSKPAEPVLIRKRLLVVRPRPHKLSPVTRCALCGKPDRSSKPLVLWMGGLVHAGCHAQEMARRRPEPWPLSKPPKVQRMGVDIHAVGVETPVPAFLSCPKCEICGKAEGAETIWVDSMWELRSGVKRGVVHRRCWDQLLREVGYAPSV